MVGSVVSVIRKIHYITLFTQSTKSRVVLFHMEDFGCFIYYWEMLLEQKEKQTIRTGPRKKEWEESLWNIGKNLLTILIRRMLLINDTVEVYFYGTLMYLLSWENIKFNFSMKTFF